MSKRRTRPGIHQREGRAVSFGQLEIRAAEGDSELVTLSGYAALFGTEYDVAGGLPYGWIETVEAGALDETLSEDPDVVLLVNHTGLPIARTKSGTLRLEADEIGLRMEADVDPSDPDVAAVLGKIERGDLDEMSWAFRVTDQSWSVHDDAPEDEFAFRHIRGANINRGDVSIVTFGANSETSVDLRSMVSSADFGELAEMRSLIDERLEERNPGGMPEGGDDDGTSSGEEIGGTPFSLAAAQRDQEEEMIPHILKEYTK